ncbi:DUF202 domain-containing protein [Saccharomonospora piscinae]|uniref:DUF202 domain-containing protein n=1 Tax=Saccharomonospora piscinae TaxID=687388 RepID=UPI0004665D3E|nr:DUF202 domain-containing protein [Saccharomonospora piscinae]
MSGGEPTPGVPAERTGLAWQRSALGAATVSALLLYQTVRTGWQVLPVTAACTAVLAVGLAAVGAYRDRELRAAAPPRPLPPAVPAAVAVLVAATALLALLALLVPSR